jgi:hypothetical protein
MFGLVIAQDVYTFIATHLQLDNALSCLVVGNELSAHYALEML